MSKETSNWLNNNVLVGFTDKRGKAWHYKASEQGAEPNHYAGPIPVGDVTRRLFSWEPVSLPVYVAVPDGPDAVKYVVQPDRKAIARGDNFDVLGMFKDGYTPHSYKQWLVGNVANLVNGEIGIGSAGLLANGARAWVQVEVPDSYKVEGVEFRPNLLASTSLDGSLATSYRRTVGIVVCDNTLDAAQGERTDVVRVKHTRYSNLKLDDAKSALKLLDETADDFAAELQRLTSWEITPRMFDKALDKLIVTSPADSQRSQTIAANKRAQVVSLYRHDNRVTPWKNTAFGVLQAFNTYETHYATVRGAHRVERNMGDVLSGRSFGKDAEVLRVLATV